uniref:Uncharacterized protein n=1 Tax=Ixodes ricinus TaxID=34613 RepID=A0A6B0U1F4_IXORI
MAVRKLWVRTTAASVGMHLLTVNVGGSMSFPISCRCAFISGDVPQYAAVSYWHISIQLSFLVLWLICWHIGPPGSFQKNTLNFTRRSWEP